MTRSTERRPCPTIAMSRAGISAAMRVETAFCAASYVGKLATVCPMSSRLCGNLPPFMLTVLSSHARDFLPSLALRATLERVSTQRVFVARLSGCSVFDPAGDRLGKVRDVVVIYRKDDPPRVVGLVVEIPGRRHVFVSIGRVTSIATGQVITTGLINVRRFQQRGGEVRVMAELLGRRVFLDGRRRAPP